MNARCQLIILIGLPGSGKSTLARQLLEAWPAYRWVSSDRIRARLFGDEAVQGDWRLIWGEIRSQLSSAVLDSPGAIYDATNAKRANRKEAIALGRELGFPLISGIWVRTPLQHCLQRNQQRHRQVPEDVILTMYRQLWGAPPALSEGMDRLFFYQPRIGLAQQK